MKQGMIKDEFSQIDLGIKSLSEGLNATILNNFPTSSLEENSKEYFEAFQEQKSKLEKVFENFLHVYEISLSEKSEIFERDYSFCKKTFIDSQYE